MRSFFTDSFTRPKDIPSDAPKGYAIAVVIGFMLILVLPTVGLAYAAISGLQAIDAVPSSLARAGAWATMIVLFVLSLPVAAKLYWKCLADDS